YNGDALGVLNDYSYANDPSKSNDNRWVHRPKIIWENAELRKKQGTVEYTIFNAMKKMISIRKEISAFADFNNRELLQLENEHLLGFVRFNHQRPSEKVLILANFNAHPQSLSLETISNAGFKPYGQFIDLYSGRKPNQDDSTDSTNSTIELQGYQFYWLTET
ncbi:MAG TPA: alpha-amylase, partial [Chroococcidiopsis sp.]